MCPGNEFTAVQASSAVRFDRQVHGDVIDAARTRRRPRAGVEDSDSPSAKPNLIPDARAEVCWTGQGKTGLRSSPAFCWYWSRRFRPAQGLTGCASTRTSWAVMAHGGATPGSRRKPCRRPFLTPAGRRTPSPRAMQRRQARRTYGRDSHMCPFGRMYKAGRKGSATWARTVVERYPIRKSASAAPARRRAQSGERQRHQRVGRRLGHRGHVDACPSRLFGRHTGVDRQPAVAEAVAFDA